MRPLCLMVFILIVRGNLKDTEWRVSYWSFWAIRISFWYAIVYASSVAFDKVYWRGLTARLQVALNKCYLWRHRIRGFLYSSIHAYAIVSRCGKIAGCLFHVRIWVSNRSSSLQSWSLLPLAFESFSLLRCLLVLWVASYLKNSYCVLRADIYLHYFAELARIRSRYLKLRQSANVLWVSRMLLKFLLASV